MFDKILEFLFKTLVIIGFIYAIYWVVATINTWTHCLVSMAESLQKIVEKLS